MKSAEENLKVIRELMERATTYRVLSTTGAVSAAVATFLAGAWLFTNGNDIGSVGFVVTWVVVYLGVDSVNTILLFRDSKRRGSEFPSPQMMHAVAVMLPGLIAGAVVGLTFAFITEDLVRCATMWVIFAGISLLATYSFGPRSIVCLGWALLGTGLGLFFWGESGRFLPGDNSVSQASFVMMTSFGLLTGLYALWTGVISKKKA